MVSRTQTKVEIRAKREYRTLGGDTKTLWIPEQKRIERVIAKNARGHAFYEYGEPMLETPQSSWVVPLDTLTDEQRSIFERIETAGWPELGSRMLTRLITTQDLWDGWVIVQDDVYRYSVSYQDSIVVKIVLWEYLAAELRW